MTIPCDECHKVREQTYILDKYKTYACYDCLKNMGRLSDCPKCKKGVLIYDDDRKYQCGLCNYE